MRKLVTLLFVMFICAVTSWAQVNLYSFAGSSGTYTPLTAGTVIATASSSNVQDDNNFTGLTIPFTFTFNGNPFTSFTINTNGFITLGTVDPSSAEYTPISSTTLYSGAIAAFAKDMDGRFTTTATRTSGSPVLTAVGSFNGVVAGVEIGGTGIAAGTTIVSFDQGAGTITMSANATAAGTAVTTVIYSGQIMTQVDGSSPNQVLTIQWRNFKRYGSGSTSYNGESYSFQIKLFETTNLVNIVYGPVFSTTSSTTGQVGLRGASNAVYHNRTTTANWAATTAGSSNSATCTMSSTVFPANGQIFAFTPPVPCVDPVSQPTGLVLTSLTSSVSGSFTPAAGSDSYLVLRSTDAALTTLPVNGTTYAVGAVLGNGTVVSNTGSVFTASGLTAATLYYFHVFSMNSLCAGGPLYLTSSTPLEGSVTTAPNPPASITATAFSNSQINLTAIANVAGNDIMVAWNTVNTFGIPSGPYNPNDPITGGGTAFYTGPVASLPNHTGLSQGVTYYYKAWSIAGGVYSSTNVGASATTLCTVPYPAPYSQNFDSGQDPPTCWSEANGQLAAPTTLTGTTSNWILDDWRNITPTTDKAEKLNIWSTGLYAWVFTPQIDLGTGTWQLEFDLTLNAYGTSSPPATTGTDDKFAVVISTDGGTTWTSANTLRLWNNSGSPYVYNAINPNGERIVIPLAGYSGIVKIGFYGESTVSNADNDLMINNLDVVAPPPCNPVSGLTTTGVTATSALLNWVPGTETMWNIKWGPAGFDPGTSGTLITGVTTRPYPLTGLDPNTSYDWYVQADCGTKAVSSWAGPANFKTNCLPISWTTFPWTENFDAMGTVGNNIFPDCWLASPTSPWYTGNAASITQNDPCSAPNYAYVSWSPSATDKFLITPPFDLKGGVSYDFKFNWVGDNYSGWTGDVMVNTAQTGTGATVLGTPFVVAATTAPATCALVTKSYIPPVNGTYYFIIRVNNNFTPYYLGFDDFDLQLSPPCPDPTDLTAAPAGFQAVLNWTSPAATFDIEWGATPYTFSGVANITGVTKPYTLLGLTPSTGYTYKVMANCDAGVNSGWSAEKTFSTTVACPAPTTLTATGMTTTTANLGWTETGAATVWDIELGPAGFTPTGIPTAAGVTTNPYTYGGLTASTAYGFYVRANCGGGSGESTWTGPFTFNTNCELRELDYCQTFDLATFPPCWSQTYDGTVTSNRWSMSNSTNAGGTAYEAMCSYQSAIGVARMVSPQFNTAGKTTVHLAFRQMINDYDAGVNDVDYKVQYRFDGGTWTNLWVHAGGIGASVPAELRELDIPVSGNILEVGWAADGNLYDINYWYVDDVCVTVPLALDAATISIDNVPSLLTPSTVVTPKATVKNVGTTSPVTFNVTMTATDGYNQTVTGVTLAAGASTQVTFPDWTPALGNWNVQVCTQLVGDMNPANDCKSKAVGVQVLKKAYCYVAYDPSLGLPEGPAWFYLQSPGTITSLATTTSSQFIGAGCWANDVWYGSEYYDATLLSGGGWWTINPITGAMTMVADFDKGFAGIAYDKVAGIMYGTNWTGTTNELYTIVPTTGVATLIGTFGGASLVINLAADGSGFLYGMDIGADALVKINPVGPTIVTVGPAGIAMNYAQDMEFDYDNNIMYAAAYTATGGLYTVNMTTGACTLVGAFQNGAEITGFAIPYSSVPVVPVNLTATGNYNDGLAHCFNATNTITVTNFTASGAGTSIQFVAGVNVLFQPPVLINGAATMWAHITSPAGPFCPGTDAMVAATGQEETVTAVGNASFTLFPNPTTGNFTLVQKGDRTLGDVKVEVYTINGDKVLAGNMIGLKQQEFRFTDMPNGIYFVRVVAEDYVETIKLVKTR